MKIMKKTISLILTMLMLISCVCIADISASAEETIVPGFYVIGSKEVCGVEWGWSNPWLYNEPMQLSANGVTYYQAFECVPSSKGHNTDFGDVDVFEFKVVYVDEYGNVAWHPGGMGNNTEVKVEESNSNILFQFQLLASRPTKEGTDPEAVIATVYGPDYDEPLDYYRVSYPGVPDPTEEPTNETTDPPVVETTDPPVVEETTNPQQETTDPVEETTAPKTGDGIHRPIVSDVVNSKEKVETNSYMFYVPDEWKNEHNNYYYYNPDTKDFTGEGGYFAAGIDWWDGVYNCIDNKGSFKTEWPGYAIVETVDGNPNIFRADVPKSIRNLEWNNLVDYGEDKNNPLYASSKRTASINCEYYDKNDYTYGFYPDGVESFDGMIYVCNPYYTPFTEYSEKFYGGAWFYYYGNGEYGIYKTREEAEANNGIYKNGKFPKYEGMPEETTTPETEPATTVAPEITSAPEVTTTPIEIETTTASQTTEPVETTEATEPATVVTEPQDTTAPEVTTTAPETTTVTEPAETKAPVQKTKKTNPIKVTVKTKTVKLKKLKNNNQKVKAITVKKAKGTVSYSLVKKGSTAKIFKLAKINKKGVITLKKLKKAKKGTYKLKVKITAKGNSEYKSKTINKVVKVKVV